LTIIISPFFVSDDRFTLTKAAGLLTGFAGVVILLYPNNCTGSSAVGVCVKTGSVVWGITRVGFSGAVW